MPITVTLKSFLDRLTENEASKPIAERVKVPNVTQLAQIIGVYQSTLSRIANGETRKIDLDLLDKIMTEIQSLGLPVEIGDLISYIPPKGQ